MQLPSFREAMAGLLAVVTVAGIGYLAIVVADSDARTALIGIGFAAAGFFVGQSAGAAIGEARAYAGLSHAQIGVRGRGEPPPGGMGGSGI